MRTSTIGIDPGLHGAVACLDEHGEIEDIFDMPTTTVGKRKNGKAKLQIDAGFLGDVLRAWKDDSYLEVYMEHVNASPGMGAVSAYSFGEGVGLVKGVVTTLGLPLRMITSVEWKKHYELAGGRENKDQALELARAQWSNQADRGWFDRKKDADRAEAALLALYAQTKFD